MECNKCAVERFVEEVYSSAFKLKQSPCYKVYSPHYRDEEDDQTFQPYSKSFSSSVLFQEFSRMVQEHSTGGDFASIRRTNGGITTFIDFSRKLSEVAKKFPDMIIKEEKGARSVFYRIVFDLDCAKLAKLAEQN